jgi:hypothetical protein
VSAAHAYAHVTRGLGVATVHQGPTLTSLRQAVKEHKKLPLPRSPKIVRWPRRASGTATSS